VSKRIGKLLKVSVTGVVGIHNLKSVNTYKTKCWKEKKMRVLKNKGDKISKKYNCGIILF
jgi:hypothetical protein